MKKHNKNISLHSDLQAQLISAVVSGRLPLVKELLGKGVSCNAVDSEGISAFEWAAITGNLELVTYLTNQGVNIKDSAALYWASSGEHFEVVKFLVEHGALVNKKGELGRTALHQASKYGYYKIISYLLDHGALAKIQDDDGKTPLDKAKEWRDFHTDNNSIACVEILESKKQ